MKPDPFILWWFKIMRIGKPVPYERPIIKSEEVSKAMIPTQAEIALAMQLADDIMLCDGDRDHMNQSRLTCEQTQFAARVIRALSKALAEANQALNAFTKAGITLGDIAKAAAIERIPMKEEG